MSAHAPTAAVHVGEEHHPRARQYIVIAAILSLITAAEVAVYYIPTMRPIITPTLIVLSSIKFSMVVMFYMHLKFDHPLFTGLFLFGLATAAFTIIVFIALFHFFHTQFVVAGVHG